MKDGCLNIVVTGEVDAGKSSLIGRFLHDGGEVTGSAVREIEETSRRLGRETEYAYLLDSFEEEREGQLTIDTTQSFFKNRKGPDLLFIDVPGHGELIKNMLTGSSYADYALLVIDIRKVIEEGTRRHIRVLDFLSISGITVVLNKLDAVDYSEAAFRSARAAVTRYLAGVGLKARAVIPVSAKQGDNLFRRSAAMPWYRGPALIDALNGVRKTRRGSGREPFCMPVQDVYAVEGRRIAVGNIVSGAVRRGDRVRVAPGGHSATVKKVFAGADGARSARASDAAGLELAPSGRTARGSVVYRGEAPLVTRRIRARVFCVRALREGEQLFLQCATQRCAARITKMTSPMEEAAAAEVVIGTSAPIAVYRFSSSGGIGRFVLKDDAGICAAGIML